MLRRCEYKDTFRAMSERGSNRVAMSKSRREAVQEESDSDEEEASELNVLTESLRLFACLTPDQLMDEMDRVSGFQFTLLFVPLNSSCIAQAATAIQSRSYEASVQ